MADQDPREQSRQGLLVADSDVLVRHVIADYLRHCGYAVIEAASFAEARAVLEAPTVTVELVLCDVELAGEGNGFALRALAAREWPEVQVILAGNIDAAARAAGELCEQGPHLARPYDPQLAMERIRRSLAQRAR